MKIFNLNGDEWDRVEDRPGWRTKDAWVGARIGAQLIGGSTYELEPGDRLWPHHTHHGNEGWFVVLRGRPTPRTQKRERELDEGDVVAFRRAQRRASGAQRHGGAGSRPHALDAARAGHRRVPRLGKDSVVDAKGERLFREFRGPDTEYGQGED